MPRHPADLAEPAGLPSPETRTWLSLLIFVHLFMVVIALSSYTSPSELQTRLKDVFAPYLQTLNLDLHPGSYNVARFYLTYNLDPDFDFALDIDAKLPDGSANTQSVPARDLWPGQRSRHQQLANVAGSYAVAGNENDSELPKAIAASALRKLGASRATVRCRALELPALGSETAPSVATYEAHVFFVSGQPQAYKAPAKSEVAPVEKAAPK